MATFTEHLRALGEPGLAALLAARPDLAAPPPSSVRSLAARAANRTSLDRALAGLDAVVLAVVEAAVALDGTVAHGDGASQDALRRATGLSDEEVDRAVTSAAALGLLWPPRALDPRSPDADLRPAPGLEDVLGPYPAGLGPRLVDALGRRSEQGLTRLHDDLGLGDPGEDPVATVAGHLAEPGTVRSLLAAGPPGAAAVLEALTWGPPVGRSPVPAPGQDAGPGRTAVEWLLRHGLLAVGDSQHVVLPREVALALRDGRTHRDVGLEPRPSGHPVDVRTVDAESARTAEDAVRLVTAVAEAWGAEPPGLLRAGGLGARELRRLATRLEVAEDVTALLVEVAAAAGLVADDGEDPPAVAPTTDLDDWLRRPLPERWQVLAETWLTSERAAWLVGTRDERGTLRAALDPELRRPWAPRLRRTVLAVLADVARTAPGTTGVALGAEDVLAVLQWRTPRSAPPLHAVQAVLQEAGALGVLGAGALSRAGTALLHPVTDGMHPVTDGTSGTTPADALADQLPPAVEEVLLQGDLTGIVPGRPSPELAALLEQATHVESRGAALTVRFTDASIRAALDAGRTAEELLADLSRYARSGVPQPLEYLVLDVARRHGRVRVGLASSYLRADDPTLLTGLVEDKGLRGLGLLRLAPTVIAAQVPPPVLLAALRERGLAPVTEGPSGQVVVAAVDARRIRRPRTGRRPAPVGPDVLAQADEARDRRLRRLAKDLLAADRTESAALSGGPASSSARGTRPPGERPSASDDLDVADHQRTAPGAGTPDPVLALALLREAAAEGREVWIDIVGSSGGSSRRRVRPLRVDAGRVRAVDPEREAELTVAVHRIAGVTPV